LRVTPSPRSRDDTGQNQRTKANRMPSNRNILYAVIGALAVVAAILGYQLYQDRKEPKGFQINIGDKGISMEKK
jgi:hypothetical protein